MTAKTRLRKWNLLVIVSVMLLVLAVPCLGNGSAIAETQSDEQFHYEDKQVTVNGQTYKPRTNLTTILFMGIDKKGEARDMPAYLDYLDGGQSDFLRLVVIDPLEKTIAQIPIDRDTMTPITLLGTMGNKVGYQRAQICLSHGMGDGQEQSCGFTVEAVSTLLRGIPIEYYIAVTMDTIPVVNDMLGGVTVTLEDDFSHIDPAMVKGTTITLMGSQAETFVRSRRAMSVGTNEARMARQQQYLSKLADLLVQRLSQNPNFVGELFDGVSPYLCTNMSRAKIVNKAWAAKDYTRLPVSSISGVHEVSSDGHMQFLADEDSLTQVVLDVFYKKLK